MNKESTSKDCQNFMEGIKKRNPSQTKFHESVEEVIRSIMPYYLDRKELQDECILERITEPDRIISFRVTWEDDHGKIHVNRAWRIQFNNILGPYKGGLRFHKSVDEDALKFLAFEQCFKNALTGLPMGGGKGGSNFDPKGKSKREIMRFCHAMMEELHRYIDPYKDVPAGDIGVSKKEISYLFGHYLKLTHKFHGVITGKDTNFGGSVGRSEATGYGCVYFLREVLEHFDDSIKNKTLAISGSGNVAIYAAEKAIESEAKVLTLSDSSGFIYDKNGINQEKLDFIKKLKFEQKGRLAEYADEFKEAEYHKDKKPWGVKCDIAMPCAIENEIGIEEAKELSKNKISYLIEGANKPLTYEAVKYLLEKKIIIAPSKAANAGGVAVSGLEQTQNVIRTYWSLDKVNHELEKIMKNIHKECVKNIENKDKFVNYIDGANISSFEKVANALLACGLK